MKPRNNKDELARAYIQDAEVFCDLANLALYQGRRVIRPEQLIEQDPIIGQKRRDGLKKWKKENGEEIYLGIEIQSVIDPSMPIRMMEYDVILYKKQWYYVNKVDTLN